MNIYFKNFKTLNKEMIDAAKIIGIDMNVVVVN